MERNVPDKNAWLYGPTVGSSVKVGFKRAKNSYTSFVNVPFSSHIKGACFPRWENGAAAIANSGVFVEINDTPCPGLFSPQPNFVFHLYK